MDSDVSKKFNNLADSSISLLGDAAGSDVCSESWVELSTGGSPERTGTPLPPPLADECMRLLREAAREGGPRGSTGSSLRASAAASRRDSPHLGSPKSPPNSPNQEKIGSGEEHWNSYFMNNEKDPVDYYYEKNLEWIWDWSSRPDQQPPKAWHFNHPKTKSLSIRYARVGDTSLFSKKGLCTLFITNVLSLLLGTGMGLWLSKRGFYIPSINLQ